MAKCTIGDAAEVDAPLNIITTTVRTDNHVALSDDKMSFTHGRMAETQRSVDEMVDKTSQKSKQEVDASDLREIEGFLTVLEQRCENLDWRLEDLRVQHEMDMRAIERNREYERAERDRDALEHGEDLLAFIITVAIRRQK